MTGIITVNQFDAETANDMVAFMYIQDYDKYTKDDEIGNISGAEHRADRMDRYGKGYAS